jgi:hypothetical protein
LHWYISDKNRWNRIYQEMRGLEISERAPQLAT